MVPLALIVWCASLVMLHQESISAEEQKLLQDCRSAVTNFAKPVQPCDKVKHSEALIQIRTRQARMISEAKGPGKRNEIERLEHPSFKDFFSKQALTEEPAIMVGDIPRNMTGMLEDKDDMRSSLTPIVQCSQLGESEGHFSRASLPKSCPSIIRNR